MSQFVYRKLDLLVTGKVHPFMSAKDEIVKNAIPNFGGKEEDYASLDVPYDCFKLERVNGEVVAVEMEPPTPEPPPPTKEDLMGMELTKMKLENFQKTQIINQLGQDLTKAKIDIIQLKGGM